MSATGYIRGHEVVWDETTQSWRYSDDGSLAPNSGGAERPCLLCGLISDGPDACFGWLPDCESACCGHGVHDGWISRQSVGLVFRGKIDGGALFDVSREAFFP